MDEKVLIYQALNSPVGIVIRTDNRKLMLQRLAKARAALDKASLLMICPSRTNPNEVWIVHRAQETGPTDSQEDGEPVSG